MPRETKPTGLARVNSSKERDKSNGGASSVDAMSVSSKTPTPEKMLISRTKEKSVYTANAEGEGRGRTESQDGPRSPIPSIESGEFEWAWEGVCVIVCVDAFGWCYRGIRRMGWRLLHIT